MAEDEDFGREFLDFKCSVKLVDNFCIQLAFLYHDEEDLCAEWHALLFRQLVLKPNVKHHGLMGVAAQN